MAKSQAPAQNQDCRPRAAGEQLGSGHPWHPWRARDWVIPDALDGRRAHDAVPGAQWLIWKWADSGTYTAKSCYQAQFHGSTASSSWKLTWKTWAPPRVKFFCWLACMDRCLLCDQILETMHHLILACPFSRQVWHEVLARLRMTCQPPNDGDTSLDDWWRKARQLTPKPLRKGLDSITLLTPWLICKHCNSCVFDRARPSVRDLVKAIFDEALCGLELARKA